MLGPLLTIILLCSYFQAYIFIFIVLIISSNWVILKLIFFQDKHHDKFVSTFYSKLKEHGRKEAEHTFYYSIFTSWISPCTVWANNKLMKSKFLLYSSLTTFLFNIMALAFVLFLIDNLNIDDRNNPPVFHCFQKSFVANLTHYYQLYHSGNQTHDLFSILNFNEETLAKIRICAENEAPEELLSKTIIPVGLILNILSFCAAIGLQVLGNYSNLKLRCQKVFYHCLNEFLITEFHKESEENIFENLKEYLRGKDYQQPLQHSLEQMKKIFKNDISKITLLKLIEGKILKKNETFGGQKLG